MKLEEKIKDANSQMEDIIVDVLKAANKEDACIKVNNKAGEVEVLLSGSTLSLLVTLAGLEITALRKLDVPKHIFDTIKDYVETGVMDNE